MQEMREAGMIAQSIGRRPWLLVSLVLMLLFSCSNLAAENMTGVYGPLTLAHDEKSLRLTGYFESYSGWDSRTRSPRFSCVFFLSGEKYGDVYRIELGSPGEALTIRGEMFFQKTDGIPSVHLKLDDIPGGCGNTFPFDLARGNVFKQDFRGKWIEIRVVSAERAYFYVQPDEGTKRSDYLVLDDILRILKKENGWVYAECVRDAITRGWIREADLFAL